jgi:hypothetical protein
MFEHMEHGDDIEPCLTTEGFEVTLYELDSVLSERLASPCNRSRVDIHTDFFQVNPAAALEMFRHNNPHPGAGYRHEEGPALLASRFVGTYVPRSISKNVRLR